MTKTIFEKIILREIPATIHHEDDDLIIDLLRKSNATQSKDKKI